MSSITTDQILSIKLPAAAPSSEAKRASAIPQESFDKHFQRATHSDSLKQSSGESSNIEQRATDQKSGEYSHEEQHQDALPTEQEAAVSEQSSEEPQEPVGDEVLLTGEAETQIVDAIVDTAAGSGEVVVSAEGYTSVLPKNLSIAQSESPLPATTVGLSATTETTNEQLDDASQLAAEQLVNTTDTEIAVEELGDLEFFKNDPSEGEPQNSKQSAVDLDPNLIVPDNTSEENDQEKPSTPTPNIPTDDAELLEESPRPSRNEQPSDATNNTPAKEVTLIDPDEKLSLEVPSNEASLHTPSKTNSESSADKPVDSVASIDKGVNRLELTSNTAPSDRLQTTDPVPTADRARFVRRVAGAMRTAQQRDGQIQLRLSPPELGSLKIDIAVKQGVVTASLETETTAARNLLLDNLPALRARLAEQEIRVERFDVDVRRDGQGQPDQPSAEERQQNQSQNRRTSPTEPSTETTAAATTASPPLAPNNDSLDIRI